MLPLAQTKYNEEAQTCGIDPYSLTVVTFDPTAALVVEVARSLRKPLHRRRTRAVPRTRQHRALRGRVDSRRPSRASSRGGWRATRGSRIENVDLRLKVRRVRSYKI